MYLKNKILIKTLLIIIFFSLVSEIKSQQETKQEIQEIPVKKEGIGLLRLMEITPSEESIDFVQNKTQFQLHALPTEQRHQKTQNLSEWIRKDIKAGLEMLISVDDDIAKRLNSRDLERRALEQAVRAVESAILSGNKIYIYGCGSSGRLAKQMESTLWRPFWKNVKSRRKLWNKLKNHLSDPIEEQLIGEMTGADRALIGVLKGFEDIQIIGRLQLEERKIKKGDVVICITEGGESSPAIGTILAALDQWIDANDYVPKKTKDKLFFIFNNPNNSLIPIDRSRRVLEEPGITKINLTTGPQSIAGSTSMQASTIGMFVLGNIIQTSLHRVLKRFISRRDLAKLGFNKEMDLEEKLKEFSMVIKRVKERIPAITKFTRMESFTYDAEAFSTYFAQRGFLTVFANSTERIQAFHLQPMDTVKEKARKCQIQVWTPASNNKEAWLSILGRPFSGLSPQFYKGSFEEEIDDQFLRRAALESLKYAGTDQGSLYDLSYSTFNLTNRSPKKDDLGVLVLLSPEESLLKNKNSAFRRCVNLFIESKAKVAIICITDQKENKIRKIAKKIPGFESQGKDSLVLIPIDKKNDPLGINQLTALKILVNAHSTAVMAYLEKVLGNTMINVSPDNLKLIGRATHLIQSFINDLLERPGWVKINGIQKPVSYGEANAVLFESIRFLKDKKKEAGHVAEVSFSIVHILESLRRKIPVSQNEALEIVKTTGLGRYLSDVTSQ